MDICSLPNGRTFASEVEMYLWLVRHQGDPDARAWWIGFEFAQRGVCWERVEWELQNNPVGR